MLRRLSAVRLVLAGALAAGLGGCQRPGPREPTIPVGGTRELAESEYRAEFPVWGVTAILDPRTEAHDEAAQLVISTFHRRAIDDGTFELRIARSATSLAGAGRIADAERESLIAKGSSASPVSDITLLGRTGRAFTYIYEDHDGRGHGLYATAVVGRCVVELRVLRAGPPEALTEAASAVLSRLGASPSPLDPRRCR